MNSLPPYKPKTLSLGTLEREIVEILWQLGPTSATAIHQQILADIDRDLTYASVSTVLNRLQKKGWVSNIRRGRNLTWQAKLSQREAEILTAHEQLCSFLAVGRPEVVAAFVDTLDDDSLAQIDEIAQKVRAARQAREESR